MTVIAACRYNNRGQLLAPTQAEINAARDASDTYQMFHDERATYDAGHYHRFVLDAYGQSEAEAQAKLDKRLADFTRFIRTKGDHRPIRRTRSGGPVGFGSQYKLLYTLIYAME